MRRRSALRSGHEWRRHLLATAAGAALAASPMVSLSAAWAQEAAISPEIAQAVVAYDIPAQDLNAALLAFANQAGLQIFYDVQRVRGLRSAPLVGRFTPRQGLTQLLAGTGISFRFTGPTTVSLETSAAGSGIEQLGPVRVQGAAVPPQAMIDNLPPPYPGGQVARGGQVGLLGERDFMSTPFNQSSYTSELMQNQQARNLADVAANDPSLRNPWPAVGYSTPFYIRGFPFNNNDLSFGGLYGVVPPLMPIPEYLERVEILKGPSAMLNGMPPFGSIGGAINLVPKRAPEQELNRVTTSFVSNAQFGGHLDVARRFDDDRIGFRFNGAYRNGSTPVDRQTQEVGAAVFGLDFRGERLRASLDYGYQTQTFNSPLRATFVNPGVPVPLAPSGRANWFQPWTYANTGDLFGAANVEYDISPDWTVFGGAGARWSTFNALTGSARVTSANGDLTETVLNFPGWTNTNTQQIGLRGRADTGPFRHAVAFSGTRLVNEGGQLFPPVVATVSNLYQPTFVAKPNVAALDPPKTASTELSSLALADVISMFDERIQLIVGARLQRVQIANYSSTTGAVTSYYDKSALSPSIGFIAKPWENVSFYGNYIEGLQRGPTAPAGTENSGEVFPPSISRQVELGVKVDFGRFASTLSLFQIEQPFGVTDPETLIFSVAGTQRNQGLEWQIFGEPLEGFRTLGGISLLNARQLNTDSALTDNLKATGVPDVQLNLGAEWDASFLRGLTFSGRVIYTSLQYLDAANTQSIPDWTRFDAGVRYTFERRDGKPISIRFNVENVLDLNYWASANSSFGLAMGGPRTFFLSLTADF